jgi:stress response protein YsnF
MKIRTEEIDWTQTALQRLIAVGKKMMKTARRVAVGAQADKIGR